MLVFVMIGLQLFATHIFLLYHLFTTIAPFYLFGCIREAIIIYIRVLRLCVLLVTRTGQICIR